jgi:four helix bundle protein
MGHPASDLLVRTRDFALAVVRLYASLPQIVEAQVMGKQLLRSGTSTGAHLREARFSRSDAEMLSKIEVGLQELEESRYWLELLVGSGTLAQKTAEPLEKEIGELIAILVTSAKRIKSRKNAPH